MKPETVFGLENAAWPALLSMTKHVLRANRLRSKCLARPSKANDFAVGDLVAENGTTAEQFSRQWERLADPRFH